jgi:hypothetical protein
MMDFCWGLMENFWRHDMVSAGRELVRLRDLLPTDLTGPCAKRYAAECDCKSSTADATNGLREELEFGEPSQTRL